jgi:hypothetical protein
MAQDTFLGTHLGRVQAEGSFDVGKELFDGPAIGEALDDGARVEVELCGREGAGFAPALRVADNDNAQLNAGLWPPGEEGFEVERDPFTVDFDANPVPSAGGLSHGSQAGKTATVFGFAAAFFDFPAFWQGVPEYRIEAQAAGQRDLRGLQGFEDSLIVA